MRGIGRKAGQRRVREGAKLLAKDFEIILKSAYFVLQNLAKEVNFFAFEIFSVKDGSFWSPW